MIPEKKIGPFSEKPLTSVLFLDAEKTLALRFRSRTPHRAVHGSNPVKDTIQSSLFGGKKVRIIYFSHVTQHPWSGQVSSK